jgi:hypothetical protein
MGAITTCRQCGMSFNPNHHLTRYCGHRCRTEAQQARQQAPSAALEVRQWEGHAIQRRRGDGFVNATAMCQATGREWFTYARAARTGEYIAALERALGSPQNRGDLIQVITTGPNHLRGTWVHPRLAVDLARWCRPAFAVWMDGWLLEQLGAPEPKPAPAPKPRQRKSAYELHKLDGENVLPPHYWHHWDLISEEERQARTILMILRTREAPTEGLTRALGASAYLLRHLAMEAVDAGLQTHHSNRQQTWSWLHDLSGSLEFAQLAVATAQQKLLRQG